MKLTKEDLDSIVVSNHTTSDDPMLWCINGSEEILDELIRVARLGLWAEEYGIPELREYSKLPLGRYEGPDDIYEDLGECARTALEALQKE